MRSRVPLSRRPGTFPVRPHRFAGGVAVAGGGLLLLLVLVGALATTPASAGAQERTVVERQVPVDSTRSIREIGPELRNRLGLFPEVENFQAARLFELEDGSTVLEITFQRDGRLWRERRQMPPPALASLRRRLTDRLAEAQPEPGPVEPGGDGGEQDVLPLEQEGRGRLVLGQTLVGLGFYGWAVPEILDVERDRPTVATYLLTAGASFYLPYRLTRNAPVRDAHRHMTLWGSTRGILYGYLGAGALTGDEDFGRREHLGASLGTSVAASYLGYRSVGWAGEVDEGTTVLWTTVADAGTLAGFGSAYVAGFYDEVLVERQIDDPAGGTRPVTVVESERENPRLANLTTLALTGAGFAAGAWLGTTDDYTVGDVSALRSLTLLGAQAAIPLAEATVGTDDDRGKRWVAGMLAGGTLGLAGGSRLLRGRSFSSSQGLLLNAGHLAGGLAALGVTWLVSSDTEGNELLYTVTSAVGSAAGLALTYRALSPGTAENPDGEEDRSVRVEVTPGALLAGLGAGAGDRTGHVVPTLLRIRF